MRRIHRAFALLAVMGGLLGPAPRLHADAPPPLADYTMTSWSRRDGVAGPIWSICQDKEGYLWVGTGSGVVRFDGHRFVSWEALGYEPLPGTTILALLSARDGSLWIAAGESGIGRLQGGKFTFFHDSALAYTRTLIEDHDGHVWAGSRGGLYQFDGTRWTPQRESVGLPISPNNGIYETPDGALWVLTLQGVFRRPPSHDRFELVSNPPPALGERRDERLAEARLAPDPPGRRFGVIRDGRGDLWIPSIGQGLRRVRLEHGVPVIERVTSSTGLSSDVVGAVFEDREANIWIGTQAALHELTPRKVTPLDELGVVGALQTTADGSTWLGSDKGLIRITKDRRDTYTEKHGLPPGAVRALTIDRAGTLWVATDRGVASFTGDRFLTLSTKEPLRFGRVTRLSIDSASTVWLTDYQLGILRLQNGVITPLEAIANIDHQRPVEVYVDRADHVWLGFGNGRLGRLESDARLSFYDVGLKGAIGILAEEPGGVLWLGGDDGIARFADNHAVAATNGANGFPGAHVTAGIDDERGMIWVGSSVGIVRVPKREFDDVASSPTHRIRYTVYDETDGLRGMPVHLGVPSAARGADGQLWFVTDGGATVVNPPSLAPAPRAPRVRIEEIRVAGVRFDPATPFRLGPHPERVEVDFTALTLTSPSGVRFRYRLSGFDSDWLEADARRQAIYTNLPPGDYKFQAVALDKEGAFDPSGATATFSIAPALYQTKWFAALVALAAIGVGTGAWRLRMRQVRARFSLVLAERTRISREVHDTLLQSLVGVAVRSGTVARRLPPSDPTGAREELNRMRKEVEEQIREVRQTIWNLRSPTLHQRGLAGGLRNAGERIAQQTSATFTFKVVGPPKPCAPAVEEQLLRIGQEALINAGRHSGASEIRAELRYDDNGITLAVVDNGVGFDVGVTAGERGDQHFGLTHMRERAIQAGGHVVVSSAKGSGTQIVAAFPLRGAA